MSGSLGRVVLDLDAELANLRQKLNQGEAEARSWAAGVERLNPSLNVNTGSAQQQLTSLRSPITQIGTDFDQLGVTASRSGTQVAASGSKMQNAMGGVADTLSPVALGWTGVGVAAVLGAKASVQAASDHEEAMARVEAVFGDSADTVKAFASTTTESLGVSESAALGAAGSFGNLFTSMGLGRGVAADMSTELVTLAADLASFNNISIDSAFEKLRAGLVGEVEPLRTLGINLNAADVAARAMSMGLAESTKALTAADKAQAAYSLILEQSANAQGDFQRNADGAANSMKLADAAVNDLQVAVGTLLTPAVADFAGEMATNVRTLTDWIEKIREADGAAADFAERLTGLDIDAGPLEGWFDTARSGGPAIRGAGEYLGFLGGKFDDLRSTTDESGSSIDRWVTGVIPGLRKGTDDASVSLQEVVDWMHKTVDAARGIENEPFFHAVWTQLQEDLAQTGTEYERYSTRQAIADREMAASAAELSEATSRQAEYAGQANERNSEYILGLELGSGAAAELAFQLDKMSEAQQGFATAQDAVSGVMATFATQGQQYQQELSALEGAYENLQARQEEGIELSATEQDFLARYPEMHERVTGAVEDAAIQEGLAASAKVDLWRAQEDLNAAIDRGEQDLTPYTQKLDDAQNTLENLDPAAGAVDAIKDLGETIRDLIEALTGLDEADAEPDISADTSLFDKAKGEVHTDLDTVDARNAIPGFDADTSAFDEKVSTAEGDIGFLNDQTATPKADLNTTAFSVAMGAAEGRVIGFNAFSGTAKLYVDTSAVDTAIEYANSLFPRSPAERGPFRVLPTWTPLFEPMVTAAARYGSRAAETAAGYFPMDTPRTGALRGGIEWDWLFAGLDPTADDYAKQAADRIRQHLTSLDLDTILTDQINLESTIAKLQAVFNGLAEMGDDAAASALAEELTRLRAEAAALAAIIETDAVQAWLAGEDAAQQAAEAAEDALEAQERLADAAQRAAESWAQVISGIANPGGLDSLAAQLRDAQLALQAAALTPGFDPAALAVLQEAYNAALLAFQQYEEGFETALANGLFTQAELIALAQEGGDALNAVIESGWLTPESIAQLAAEGGEALSALVEAGLLSDEQIEALVASADEATREILAAFFGEDAIAEIEDRLNDIDGATYEALRSMVEQGFLSGQDLVNAVADGLASGRLSVQQAMELIGEDIQSISDENSIALIDTYESLGEDLARAYASGNEDAIAAAQAAWDEFIAYLATIAEASGMTVEEIIEHFEDLRSAALETQETLTGVSIGVYDAMAPATASLSELEQAIRDADAAAREADAAPIVEAWRAGTITLEEARLALDALESELSDVGNQSERTARQTVSSISSIRQAILQLALDTASGYTSMDDALKRLTDAAVANGTTVEDELVSAIEFITEKWQQAVLIDDDEQIAHFSSMLTQLLALSDSLGFDIGTAIGEQVEAGIRAALDMHSPPRVLVSLFDEAAHHSFDAWDRQWQQQMHRWTAFDLPALSDSLVTPGALSGMVTLASSQGPVTSQFTSEHVRAFAQEVRAAMIDGFMHSSDNFAQGVTRRQVTEMALTPSLGGES